MDGGCFSLVVIGSERSFEKKNFFLHFARGGWMGGYNDRLGIAMRKCLQMA